MTVTTSAATTTRLVSLDVFRGLTMAGMVIVNNPGDWGQVYWPLLHADWHGWTPTDLIFPFFLFTVGVSITLSRRSGAGWGSILRRAAIIFALGLLLAGYPRFDLTRWRIPGVLQRIALCYLAAAAVYRLVRSRPDAASASRSDVASAFRRTPVIIAAVTLLLLLSYWLAIAGDLTPDGNLGARIDRAVFGAHLWASSKTWDPEGLLSTVPAVATTLLGVLAGMWLGAAAPASGKAVRLVLVGVAGAAAGLLWDQVFPINKNLWTSSYAVFTAGAAAIVLGGLLWIIDARGWRAWTPPFVILGTNAITLFVVSGLLVKTLALIRVGRVDGGSVALSRYVYAAWYAPLAAPKTASLLYALTHLLVLFGLLAWLYRRRIFLKA
jgi:predicted acyltransferase